MDKYKNLGLWIDSNLRQLYPNKKVLLLNFKLKLKHKVKLKSIKIAVFIRIIGYNQYLCNEILTVIFLVGIWLEGPYKYN